MAWLNKERLTVYPRIFVAVYLIIYAYWIFSGSGIIDRNNNPIGGDFIGFWAASKIILSGNPSDVYNHEKLFTTEQKITGVPYLIPIFYPPSYLLLIAPLALLPYFFSLIIWLAITFLLYLLIVRRIAPHPATVWLAIAFPGTFQNLIHGQNGFLTATLLGVGLLWVDRFPFASGILFGLLTIKPHLSVLIPVALIAGRRWKVLIGMITSTVSLMIISAILFGIEPWISFPKRIFFAFKFIEASAFPLYQMPTTFAAALLAGASATTAKIIHGSVAAISMGITIWLWLRNAPYFLRTSSLALGALIFPFSPIPMTSPSLPFPLLGLDGKSTLKTGSQERQLSWFSAGSAPYFVLLSLQ